MEETRPSSPKRIYRQVTFRMRLGKASQMLCRAKSSAGFLEFFSTELVMCYCYQCVVYNLRIEKMCTFFDDFSVTMDICAQLFVQKQYINRIFSDKNLLEMTIVANDAAPTDAGAIQLERRHLPDLAVKDRKIVKFPAKQHGRRQRGGRKNGKKTLKSH